MQGNYRQLPILALLLSLLLDALVVGSHIYSDLTLPFTWECGGRQHPMAMSSLMVTMPLILDLKVLHSIIFATQLCKTFIKQLLDNNTILPTLFVKLYDTHGKNIGQRYYNSDSVTTTMDMSPEETTAHPKEF